MAGCCCDARHHITFPLFFAVVAVAAAAAALCISVAAHLVWCLICFAGRAIHLHPGQILSLFFFFNFFFLFLLVKLDRVDCFFSLCALLACRRRVFLRVVLLCAQAREIDRERENEYKSVEILMKMIRQALPTMVSSQCPFHLCLTYGCSLWLRTREILLQSHTRKTKINKYKKHLCKAE